MLADALEPSATLTLAILAFVFVYGVVVEVLDWAT